jgi:hypothetical protein
MRRKRRWKKRDGIRRGGRGARGRSGKRGGRGGSGGR